MPFVEPINALSYSPYGSDADLLPTLEGAGSVLGAAFRQENPIVSSWNAAERPAFERDPNFKLSEVGPTSDLWYDHYLTLGQAQSADEFSMLEGEIRREIADRQLLASAGWKGLAAGVLAGTLSPTMLLPFVGPAKGARGVAQAFALAGAAASADELMLLESQLTRTGEEVGLGIAAGTVLGGLLGGAYVLARPAERAKILADITPAQVDRGTGEFDMAPTLGDTAIPHSIGTHSEIKLPSTMSVEEMRRLDPEDLRILKEVEDELDDLQLRALRDTDQSLGAAGRTRAGTKLQAPNVVSRFMINALGRLNPVTRNINQELFPEVKAFTLQVSDAGLRTESNLEGIAHAPEGTLQARIAEYQGIEAQFLQELDDGYSRHILGDRVPQEELQGASRARLLAAVNRPEGKLSQEDFNKEVFLTAQTGKTHELPEVNRVAASWEKLATTIRDYAAEAHAFRQMSDPEARPLIDPDANLGPDAEKWLNHVFSDRLIGDNPIGFLDMLTKNAERIKQTEFTKSFEKFQTKRAAMETDLAYAKMPAEEARKAYTQIENELDELMADPNYANWKEETLLLDKQIRGTDDTAIKEQLKQQKKELTENRPEEVRQIEAEIKVRKGAQASLKNNVGKLQEQNDEIAAKIEELEAQDLNALGQVTNAGVRLAAKLNRVSDKVLDAEEKRLWAQLGKALKSVDRQDNLIQKIYGKKRMTPEEQFDAYNRTKILSTRRAKADTKAEELVKKIEKVESLDRAQARELLYAVQDLNNVRTRELNARRAVREEKLAQSFTSMDPGDIAIRIREKEAAIAREEELFTAKWFDRGADEIDTKAGTANFSRIAREQAEELSDKIRGFNTKVAGLEILGGKRGSELARVLNIPLAEKMKFLETDMERLSRMYIRQIAPDIELYRATGSVNAAPVFKAIQDRARLIAERIEQSEVRPKSNREFRRWANGEPVDLQAVETVPFTREDKAKVLGKLDKRRQDIERDTRVIVQRLRHQRGIPEHPDGILFRMGRAAMDVNVFRYMGMVAVSSAPDIARPVMRYGVMKTLRKGYKPFVSDLRRVSMTRAQANRMGIALDPVMHNRAQQVMDLMDDYASRKTKGERVLGFLANKTGFVAGFDRWTAEMKQITAAITIGEVSDALRLVNVGSGSAKELAKARKFLAENGIEEGMAQAIWRQYNLPDGSTEFADGFRLPNTESWTDLRAKRAYAAAINRMVDDLIVTPGVDKPNWVDQNAAFKMLAQFRSFTFASTNRVLLSAAQQQDMALVNGVAFSLALGALSYYIWAVSVGGEALETANKMNLDEWADEMISRSGLLGVFAEPYNVAQRIPALQDYVTFANQRTTRRQATGLIGTVAGPSYDLAEKIASIIMGMDEPTQSTLHQGRLLSVYQNVWWLRQAIDAVEQSIGETLNLPERRQ